MIHPTPIKVLLTTTFEPLVRQLSGSLARGVRLIDQFVHDEPTPQNMMTFERDLSILLRDVGRRIMAWVALHKKSGHKSNSAVNQTYSISKGARKRPNRSR
jgi:hypothetical protein